MGNDECVWYMAKAETGGAFWELFSHSRYGMPDQTGQGGADAVELEALLDVRGRMRCNVR